MTGHSMEQPTAGSPREPLGGGVAAGPIRKWVVSQVGRRQDYLFARGLHRGGELLRLFTDCWVPYAHTLLRSGPPGVRDLPNRSHPELPRRVISSFTGRSLAGELLHRLRHRPEFGRAGYEREWKVRVAYDRLVARRVSDLAGPGVGVFGFCLESLETLRAARDRGALAVCDQFDPAAVEDEIVERESAAWPGWEADRPPGAGEWRERMLQRMREQWREADLVVVNSRWSRDALVRQGVPDAKIAVVPLGYEAAGAGRPVAPGALPRLTVLWLGSVLLRKGIPYVLEAARLLAGEDIEFLVAGPVGISPEVRRQFPASVRFLGKVSGPPKADLYRRADVFILPTLSDGFAITQVEAMAHGVPVIATPNCGEVVTPGRDGFLIPARDGRALAERILQLHRERQLLRSMSAAALETSRRFSIRAVTETMTRAASRAAA